MVHRRVRAGSRRMQEQFGIALHYTSGVEGSVNQITQRFSGLKNFQAMRFESVSIMPCI
jgi:hypothetical protein